MRTSTTLPHSNRLINTTRNEVGSRSMNIYNNKGASKMSLARLQLDLPSVVTKCECASRVLWQRRFLKSHTRTVLSSDAESKYLLCGWKTNWRTQLSWPVFRTKNKQASMAWLLRWNGCYLESISTQYASTLACVRACVWECSVNLCVLRCQGHLHRPRNVCKLMWVTIFHANCTHTASPRLCLQIPRKWHNHYAGCLWVALG